MKRISLFKMRQNKEISGTFLIILNHNVKMSYQDFEFFKSVIDIQFLSNFAVIMGKNEQVLKAKASDTYFLLFWKLANIAITIT